MNKQIAKPALSKIWALVYRSTQVNLSYEQCLELETAIDNLRISIDADELLDRRASFVRECAQSHLSALMSVPPRSPQGVEALIKDCENLQKMLD